jgi:hypothetical protein
MSDLVDGTSSWFGGMDTSRHPSDIGKNQYSKAVNVIIPRSLGGIKTRPGFHFVNINFANNEAKDIYENGAIFAEGSFTSFNKDYLVALVDGYVFRFRLTSEHSLYGEIVNYNNRNVWTKVRGWCITIPGGCIINNGYDAPIYITGTTQRRLDTQKGELPVGMMGVYVQNRLFMVDQSGRIILASDFMQPTKFTLEDTNIQGFMAPDEEEKITAVGKQNTILDYSEGGNLVWSTNKNIYSTDVRGTRSEWASLGSSLGKTTQTVPGIAAVSPYSFESFNNNIYFRDKRFGMSDLRQSLYQYGSQDSLTNQAIEASYFFENDTDWLLNRCYSKSCNHNLITTIAPEISERGNVYWNGLLVFSVPVFYTDTGGVPRRFESVFTGVRPWAITSVATESGRDILYVHSHDKDGINRIYYLNEDSSYDLDKNGNPKEIEGFIETKGYNYGSGLTLKSPQKRIYKLNEFDRDVSICVYSRPESSGEWVLMWGKKHLVCRNNIKDGFFHPMSSSPQVRPFETMGSEKFGDCHKGNKFFSIQYRIEFKGPLNLDALVLTSKQEPSESVIKTDEVKRKLSHSYRKDYCYLI